MFIFSLLMMSTSHMLCHWKEDLMSHGELVLSDMVASICLCKGSPKNPCTLANSGSCIYITSNQRGTLQRIRGSDHLVVGFTTTYVISIYHHKICEFEFRSVEIYSIQHIVIEFVSDLRQVGGFFPGTPVSLNNKTEGNDKTEILLNVAFKHHNSNP